MTSSRGVHSLCFSVKTFPWLENKSIAHLIVELNKLKRMGLTADLFIQFQLVLAMSLTVLTDTDMIGPVDIDKVGWCCSLIL